MHYFERWDAHNKARDKARKDAAAFAADSLERLSDATKTPTSQLKFIMDGWAQARAAVCVLCCCCVYVCVCVREREARWGWNGGACCAAQRPAVTHTGNARTHAHDHTCHTSTTGH
jgi:hypothetical protein